MNNRLVTAKMPISKNEKIDTKVVVRIFKPTDCFEVFLTFLLLFIGIPHQDSQFFFFICFNFGMSSIGGYLSLPFLEYMTHRYG